MIHICKKNCIELKQRSITLIFHDQIVVLIPWSLCENPWLYCEHFWIILKRKCSEFLLMYGGPSLPIKKTKNNQNNNKNTEIKNENKKIEKMKKLLFTKKPPQKYHGLRVSNLIIFFIQKEKNNKLPWPMSAKSYT